MKTRSKKSGQEGWITHDEARDQLLQIPGVQAGVDQQQRIFALGKMLREIREAYLKMTQTQAAELIGMPQSELSRIEAGTGARGPTFTTVISIVDKYERHLAPSGVEIGLSLEVAGTDGEAVHYALAGREAVAGQ